MKKIAIVGANSYIARNLFFVLQQQSSCEIFLYDNLSEHLDGAKNYQQIDLFSIQSIAQIDMNCDVIYMFVGKTGSVNGFDEYNLFIDVNERALLSVLNEYRRQNSSAKIIFPSTRLVYKGCQGLRKESDEKEFKTIYAINKYACEQYLEQYHRVYGVKYCIFRICLPYGTLISGASSYGTAEFMISKAKNSKNISLYGDGEIRRTITYIKDLCEVLIQGSFSENCENDVFNVGGEDFSLKEMATYIAERYNVGLDYVPWPDIAYKIESGDTVFDDEKLQNAIGEYKYCSFLEWMK